MSDHTEKTLPKVMTPEQQSPAASSTPPADHAPQHHEETDGLRRKSFFQRFKHDHDHDADSKKGSISVDAQSIASTTTDAASTAPLLKDGEVLDETTGLPRRKSLIERFKAERAERKAIHRNLYDNGPYMLVFDPNLGKEILRKNPDWPYKGSADRENEGLEVPEGMEHMPDEWKQTHGKWKQTSNQSAQEYFSGTTAGIL